MVYIRYISYDSRPFLWRIGRRMGGGLGGGLVALYRHIWDSLGRSICPRNPPSRNLRLDPTRILIWGSSCVPNSPHLGPVWDVRLRPTAGPNCPAGNHLQSCEAIIKTRGLSDSQNSNLKEWVHRKSNSVLNFSQPWKTGIHRFGMPCAIMRLLPRMCSWLLQVIQGY